MLLALSIACFALSLALGVFRRSPTEPFVEVSLQGLLILLLGWVPMGDTFAWLANPAWAIATWKFGQTRFETATLWAAAAIALGLTTLLLETVPSEPSRVYAMGLGFYMWLAAMSILFVGGLYAVGAQRLRSA